MEGTFRQDGVAGLASPQLRGQAMWVVGAILLLSISAAIIVAVGWTPRATPDSSPWNLPELGGTYTGVVGTLAGFSVASAFFIAGLGPNEASPAFPTLIGMLLIAFLILITTAMMYASMPNRDPPEGDDVIDQAMTNALANTAYLLGIGISWLALRPLLEVIGLRVLAAEFSWVLLVLVLGGGGRLALFTYRLTSASGAVCAAIPILGLLLPTVYVAAATRLWPALWPGEDATLRFAFVAFGLAVLLFALQSVLLTGKTGPRLAGTLRQGGHRIALVASQAAVVAVVLIWFAVAMP